MGGVGEGILWYWAGRAHLFRWGTVSDRHIVSSVSVDLRLTCMNVL